MKADYEERKQEEDCYDIIVKDTLDVQYQVCDLTSLKSTKKFIDWFKSTGLTLNVFVCNACTYSLQEGLCLTVPAFILYYCEIVDFKVY